MSHTYGEKYTGTDGTEYIAGLFSDTAVINTCSNVLNYNNVDAYNANNKTHYSTADFLKMQKNASDIKAAKAKATNDAWGNGIAGLNAIMGVANYFETKRMNNKIIANNDRNYQLAKAQYDDRKAFQKSMSNWGNL